MNALAHLQNTLEPYQIQNEAVLEPAPLLGGENGVWRGVLTTPIIKASSDLPLTNPPQTKETVLAMQA